MRSIQGNGSQGAGTENPVQFDEGLRDMVRIYIDIDTDIDIGIDTDTDIDIYHRKCVLLARLTPAPRGRAKVDQRPMMEVISAPLHCGHHRELTRSFCGRRAVR
jgi:hypothetical protein